jgi:ABC-type uncharacterized transport system auxiliary subunit
MNFWALSLIAAVIGLLASGCGLSRPYPSIRSFTLEAQSDLKDQVAPSRKRLLVQVIPNGAAAACETRKLVYKIGPNELSEDFYNEFTGLPARMAADETARFLEAQGVFRTERTETLRGSDLILELFLGAFHGDYTTSPPQAVMEIKYTLTDIRRSPVVLASKTYRAAAELPPAGLGDRPSDLAAGLARALGTILAELSVDLRTTTGGR